MCRLYVPLFWLAMWVIVSPAMGQVTTWKDDSGKFSVQAELVAASNEQVTLRQSDGKEIQVPVARLSQESRKHVDAWIARSDKQITTTDPIVGVTINAAFRSRVVPLNFFGFCLNVKPQETVIISSQNAHNKAFEANSLSAAIKKAEIFALDGGKRLLIGAGQPLPSGVVESAKYLDGIFVMPAPPEMCSAPLRLASTPISPGNSVWVADINVPDSSAKQRVAETKWVECKVLYFRKDGYFIERVDGAPISEAGVPVANADREVVGIVKSLSAKSATDLTLHTGHVATLTGLEASLSAKQTESK